MFLELGNKESGVFYIGLRHSKFYFVCLVSLACLWVCHTLESLGFCCCSSFQEDRYCVAFFEGTAFLSERYDFLGCISCVKSPYVSKKASPIVFMLLSMERSIFWLFSLESLQESKSHVA